MQIEKHDKSHIVKLEDGSSWRIWPGDIDLTLTYAVREKVGRLVR